MYVKWPDVNIRDFQKEKEYQGYSSEEEDDSEFDEEFFLSKQALDGEIDEEIIETDELVDDYALKNLHHNRVALLLSVQLLYAYDMQLDPDVELLQQFLWDKKARPRAKEFAKKMTNEVLADLNRWDEEVEKYLIGWTWGRVSPVLRSILRIGTCEISLQKRPGKVIIYEVLEITKFLVDDDKSRKFVNGILDKILQKNTSNERNK